MGREKISVGRTGEDIAFKYLRKRGYGIMHVNYRTPFGEIDAVAKHKGWLVFVEVKTRTSASFGPPSLAVTPIKQRHIIKSAYAFLKMRRLFDIDWRIDVVSVMLNSAGGPQSIELIENAVEDIY